MTWQLAHQKNIGARIYDALRLDSGWDFYLSWIAVVITMCWAGFELEALEGFCRLGIASLIIALLWLFNAKRANAHARLVQSQELHPLVRRLTTAGNMRRFSLAMASFSAVLGLFSLAAYWLLGALSS